MRGERPLRLGDKGYSPESPDPPAEETSDAHNGVSPMRGVEAVGEVQATGGSQPRQPPRAEGGTTGATIRAETHDQGVAGGPGLPVRDDAALTRAEEVFQRARALLRREPLASEIAGVEAVLEASPSASLPPFPLPGKVSNDPPRTAVDPGSYMLENDEDAWEAAQILLQQRDRNRLACVGPQVSLKMAAILAVRSAGLIVQACSDHTGYARTATGWNRERTQLLDKVRELEDELDKVCAEGEADLVQIRTLRESVDGFNLERTTWEDHRQALEQQLGKARDEAAAAMRQMHEYELARIEEVKKRSQAEGQVIEAKDKCAVAVETAAVEKRKREMVEGAMAAKEARLVALEKALAAEKAKREEAEAASGEEAGKRREMGKKLASTEEKLEQMTGFLAFAEAKSAEAVSLRQAVEKKNEDLQLCLKEAEAQVLTAGCETLSHVSDSLRREFAREDEKEILIRCFKAADLGDVEESDDEGSDAGSEANSAAPQA